MLGQPVVEVSDLGITGVGGDIGQDTLYFAFVLLDGLSQDGAVGSELFDGFELLDREQAREIFRTGRDKHGNFYSLAAWMVLSIFLSMF